jgi:hypothetical protein
MRTLILFAVLALMPVPAVAATLNFTCDVDKNLCQCKVNRDGDCDAMKKNCSNGEVGWCGVDYKGALSCWCSMSLKAPSTLAPKVSPRLMQRQ